MPAEDLTHAVHRAPVDHEARITHLENPAAVSSKKLDEIHAAVVGSSDGTRTGMAEEIRHLKQRVSFLESLVKWLAGVGTAVLTATLIAAVAVSRLAH